MDTPRAPRPTVDDLNPLFETDHQMASSSRPQQLAGTNMVPSAQIQSRMESARAYDDGDQIVSDGGSLAGSGRHLMSVGGDRGHDEAGQLFDGGFREDDEMSDDDKDSSVYEDAIEDQGGVDDEVGDPKVLRISDGHLDAQAEVNAEGQIAVEFRVEGSVSPESPPSYASEVFEYGVDPARPLRVPSLRIVIFIVGSRGDVQPYLAAALHLIKTYEHVVRIATHDVFEEFVLEQAVHLRGLKTREERPLEENLEFFGVGGDPKELMSYMVKHPGLFPGPSAIRNRDIPKKQAMVNQMLRGFYRSTFQPCPKKQTPFAVDVIVSNPPAFGHVHIAEALGVPLIMSFTMPWSPTTEFPQPLVDVVHSDAPQRLRNYLTYALADGLTWQGLGRGINRCRRKRLGLVPLTAASGATAVDRLRVPFLYCWSPALIPKPGDWGQNIDVTGFLFLESKSYSPPNDLAEFLKGGKTPIYIGFGSIVVEDPVRLTDILLEAVAKSGVRALISMGWSRLGGRTLPDNVFALGDVPHDWLFSEGRVSAVCIHGGAGTMAIALKNGLPTIVVPFFGDQSFWGAMIHRRGAGPEPIKYKNLNADNLSLAIKYALSEEASRAANEMGAYIRAEDGASQFANALHSHLPLLNMRCEIETGRVAVWWSQKYFLRLSALAAEVLISAGKLSSDNLKLWRPVERDLAIPASDPLSGGAMACVRATTELGEGLLRIFSARPYDGLWMIAKTPSKVCAEVFCGLTEGFETAPHIWGTKDRRPRTKVRDAASGFRAGGESIVYGFYDGFTALAVDPYLGVKQEGTVGFFKGLGRGIMNVGAQPLAGLMGAVAHPMRGVGKQMRRTLTKEPADMVLARPRAELGKRAAQSVDAQMRRAIIDHFESLSRDIKKRKKAAGEEAKRWAAYMEQRAIETKREQKAMKQGKQRAV